ncbi:MAG: galactonate dehydratase [Anaerolineae bacterium]
MKIDRVESRIVFGGWRNWIFVIIRTDQGLTGYGEATIRSREHTVVAAIEDMARYLLGKDPLRIEEHWQALYRGFHWRGGPILLSALSGIEQALWDILGKSVGLPVHALLGGACRDRVRAYANGWYTGAKTPDEFARRAADIVAQGWTALKWNPFHGADRWMERDRLQHSIACVRAVREAVGPHVDLAIETHGLFEAAGALRMLHALEPYDVFFVEEPLPPENAAAMAALKRQVRVPIATGERRYTKWGFTEVLEQHAADIIQPDVCHAGGILELKKIAAMAEAHYVGVAPHNSGGPIGTAASLQVDACTPNFLIQECDPWDVPWRAELVNEPVERLVDGYFPLPTAPGLGATLNEKVAEAHPYQPADSPAFVVQH